MIEAYLASLIFDNKKKYYNVLFKIFGDFR